MGKRLKGPLAELGPGDKDVPLAEGEMPKDIEEKVLEEVGSLQYKAVMLAIEDLKTEVAGLGKKIDKLLKGKKQ